MITSARISPAQSLSDRYVHSAFFKGTFFRASFFIGACVFLIAGLYFVPVISDRWNVRACETHEQQDRRFDCWFDIIRVHMQHDDAERALSIFSYLYRQYPEFSQTGCHQHVHRVGDMAYYELYRGKKTLETMRFPQETTACGYGFYHGFFEHLIQDNPRPEFIAETCTAFEEKLSSRMGSIRSICFHGSGHGIMLAQAENLGKKSWGKEQLYTHPSLTICDSLATEKKVDKRECREGVYNVLVDWATRKEYGFSLVTDPENIFAFCTRESNREWRRACYNETGQKLDTAASFYPRTLEQIVKKVPEADFRYGLFATGIAGMLQSRVGSGNEEQITSLCDDLSPEYSLECVRSVVGGVV